MPLYEYQCDACSNRFERIQKFSDPPSDVCPACGGPVQKLFSSPAIQFKGIGLLHHRLRRRSPRRERRQVGSSKSARHRRESDVRRARRTPRVVRRRVDEVTSTASDRATPSSEFRRRRRGSRATTSGSSRSGGHVRVRVRAGSRGTARRGPAGAARSRRPPSGIRACCRCRGGRRRSRSRRSAAPSAAGAGRWSAGSRRCDRLPVASSAGKMSGVRM